MSECWSEKPEDRPTFQWICAAIKRLINDQKVKRRSVAKVTDFCGVSSKNGAL